METGKTLLRHLRRDREMTLEQLSDATGIDRTIISKAERRKYALNDDQKNTLAAYFNVAKDALLDDASKTVAA